ncbi:MAG: hypothetical protein V4478_03165 [Patescibacteria group bacterium]
MKRSRALRIAALFTACLYLSPFGALLTALSVRLFSGTLPSYLPGLAPGVLFFIGTYCAIMIRSFIHRVYHSQTGRLP